MDVLVKNDWLEVTAGGRLIKAENMLDLNVPFLLVSLEEPATFLRDVRVNVMG